MRVWLRRRIPRAIYGPYRRQRVKQLISSYKPRVVSHRYSGVPLNVRLADPVAADWYDCDWPVSVEIRFLRERGILEDALVFDLGAHYAVKASLLAAGGADVVAVEPLAHNVRAAEHTLRLNPELGQRITLVQAAVTSRPGPTKIAFELNSRVDQRGAITAPGVTIDELAAHFGQPDLVYMDIEGGELQALEGATHTLRHSCAWVIEVHGDERSLRAALSHHRLRRLVDDQVFLVAEPAWRPSPSPQDG